MLTIYVDADACPVKEDIYRVAERYQLTVLLVAAKAMRHPRKDWIRLIEVGEGFDAADDWIAEHVQADDIVITADVPLASRCVKAGASVIGPTGRPFTEDNIGDALASRHLLTMLREQGEMTKGPPPFSQKDRSQFLQRLDQTVNEIKRENE